MPAAQPNTTLFPYTTLFRSPYDSHLRNPHTSGRSSSCARRHILQSIGDTRQRSSCSGRDHDSCHRTTSTRRLDRKSTRLNSSHLVISYAVFCLKKKTSAIVD